MHTENSAQRKPITVVNMLLILLLAVSLLPFIPGTAHKAEAAVAVQSGYGTLDANSANATTIAFNGKLWNVIGFSDTVGNTSSADIVKSPDNTTATAKTATLFLANGQSFGSSAFGNTGTNSNVYKGSKLHTTIEGYAPAANTSEGALVIERTLPGGGNNLDSDKIAGAEVADARYWPLSVTEARAIYSYEGREYGDYWWLRSPGSITGYAAFSFPTAPCPQAAAPCSLLTPYAPLSN